MIPVVDRNREDQGAGRILTHAPGMADPLAQRVVNQIADGGTIARPGETVVERPALEGFGRRALARFHIGQHFDGRCHSSGKAHQFASPNEQTLTRTPEISTKSNQRMDGTSWISVTSRPSAMSAFRSASGSGLNRLKAT